MALMQLGVSAKSLLGDQVAVHTDSAFGKARIERIDTQTLKADLDQGVVPVVAGFQGVNGDGDITTLGRGGSDTSAVALAAGLHADECEICTDVDGVYTADPRIIKDARRLDQVTFEEMLELASLGSKVLHPRSVEFAGRYKVPLRVLSTFQEGPGTLITMEMDNMEQAIVSGIAHALDEAKITVAGVPDIPGVASKILGPIGRKNIEVDMILQNTGADGLTDFTFTVKRQDFAEALATLENMAKEFSAREISGDDAIAKVSIVGVGMITTPGVTYRMNPNQQLYFSVARAHKEPNRTDFENGNPLPEELTDFELGWRYNQSSMQFVANAYFMDYTNQLVLTGAIDEVGAPIRTNSGSSYRLGVELDLNWAISDQWQWQSNLSLSENKNRDFFFERDAKLQSLGNTNLSFSPNVVGTSQLHYKPTDKLSIGLFSKYVGEQFLGNIDSPLSKLEAYSTQDINIQYMMTPNWCESLQLQLLLNNILDKKYVSNGYFYTYDDDWSNPGSITTIEGVGYYPQAGFHFLTGMTINF